MRAITILPLIALLSIGTVHAACHDRSDEKNVYWGDLHIHTFYSMDAYVFGARRTPRDAYSFAKGEPEPRIGKPPLALTRPLDFAAVTDHGEYLAVTQTCLNNDTNPYCKKLNKASAESGLKTFVDYFLPPLMAQEPICPAGQTACVASRTDAWQDIQDAANEANEPCQFTAFIGNEWSASPDNLHWHRNHIYKGMTVPARPINSLDEPDELDMWRALKKQCLDESNCDVLAIPHNSNIGMGGSFRTIATDEAKFLRARLERLAEIHQHKGTSECFRSSQLTDEACDFEIMLPIPVSQAMAAEKRDATTEELSQTSAGYLRDTLARGLTFSDSINPFRYGFIGSTDTHGARPGYVEEQNWQGTFNSLDGEEESRLQRPHYNPGGLAAVWAEENTRDAIFAALKRRETFATSGPRIRLRFRQSFAEDADLCDLSAPAPTVMGGTLSTNGASPRFGVFVQQDQAPLAQIDIIKLKLTGDTVTQHITTFASNGGKEWCVNWVDLEHEPGDTALWYARVLEAPTKRWSYRSESPVMLQERAWSSPIWSR